MNKVYTVAGIVAVATVVITMLSMLLLFFL
jgi:hypothetical protein